MDRNHSPTSIGMLKEMVTAFNLEIGRFKHAMTSRPRRRGKRGVSSNGDSLDADKLRRSGRHLLGLEAELDGFLDSRHDFDQMALRDCILRRCRSAFRALGLLFT